MDPFTNQLNTTIVSNQKNQSVDLKSIISTYLFHWPLFVLGLIIAFTAAFIYLKTAKPSYEIKASVIIKDQSKSPRQQSALQELEVTNSAQIIENEIEILKSKQLISQVVNDLKLWISYQKKDGLSYQDLYKTSPVKFTLIYSNEDFEREVINIIINDSESYSIVKNDGTLKNLKFNTTYKNEFGTWKIEPTENIVEYKNESIRISIQDPENVALQYQKEIDASLVNKLATTVVLTMNDQSAQKGKDILNHLIYNYNLSNKLEKNRETKSTLDFIDQRLSSLTGELNNAEKGIEGFMSSQGLTDISSESKINLENLQANDSKLNEVNVQLSVIEGIERYVNSAQNSGRAPATLGITDPALNSSIAKLAELQLLREKLLATTPETNPDFEPINRQIVSTRASIIENVKNIKSTLLDARNKLQSYNARFETSIKNIPTQERQYINIKRQQTIKENLYTYLLQKREEVSVSYASTLSNDRIVDQAYASPPKRLGIIIYPLALLLGLALPTGLLYARNNMSEKITNITEIKGSVELPVICELPMHETKNPIVINDTNTTPISEQFRSLRTKLFYLYGSKESGRITLVTSSVPGEGKSFISINLGITMASAGRKTIILEMDMRKPTIAKTLNLQFQHAGISNYLNSTSEINNIIQKSKSANLDIISAGSMVTNPSELLEKNRLKLLLSDLQNQYEDIIIDSPPVHLVPDAMIISRLTDLTLYIIQQGFTSKSELNIIRELDQQ